MNPRTVLVATSNPGKLRDFAGAAAGHRITIAAIPGFSALPPVVEDGLTFEANARKKAEEYSRAVPEELVLADDSGLEVDALNGAPGVHSARYAAAEFEASAPITGDLQHHGRPKPQVNSGDEANNARLLRELAEVPEEKRTARFVCVLAAARNGKVLATFRGAAEGLILNAPRGSHGFGYDPLFHFPEIGKTFAELSPEEKSKYSHRGAAFRAFLAWFEQNLSRPRPTAKTM
jgi:XTP/dITP diphosphohydrolase